jgi:hypothetical protein
MIFVNACPPKVATNPKNTLSPAYREKYKKLPSLRSAIFSFEKVEKVVKPPQNPTVRKNRSSVLLRLPRSERPKSKPIRKQPRRFTIKVPKGKAEMKVF